MSEQRITYGLVVVLDVKLTQDERDDLYDELESDNMAVNYDGTLVYLNAFDGESWDAEFISGINAFGSRTEFFTLCAKHGLSIQPGTVDVFYANWYDGCDSPMSTMTLSQFLGDK